MKLSWFGRLALALFASLALGLGMSACGGGTIAYIWVAGTQFNQIAAFKVDDYTGNLTQAPHQPFGAQGANPIMILVKNGGRYIYLLNQGSADTPTKNSDDANIVEFSVGGDGSLSKENVYTSQGFQPMWMQFSADNNYLYVLDKYSPSGDGNGSITAFAIDPTTGRLSLVLNNQSVPPGGTAPTFWEVGASPFMMKQSGSCLFTVNSADQSITPYSSGAGGQLVNVTTGKIATGANNISSINGNAQYIILTDSGANQIVPYTIAGACGLSTFAGGRINNITGTSNPTNSFLASGSNKTFLYILNQSTTTTTTTTPFSSISAFLVDPSNGLQPISGTPLFGVDSGPVCMVEDPTSQYMYISDRNSGQITGKKFDASTGTLSALPRGSTFSATGQATCLAISGSVD